MTIRFVELYGSITLQSQPRPGRRAFGVPVGGPFDLESHTLANGLLGNEPDCPCIELTAAAGKIEAEEPGALAWVGAGAYQGVRTFARGERFELPYPKAGCRSYLAMHGGVSAKEGGRVFESRTERRIEEERLASPPGFGSGPVLRAIRSQSCSEENWRYLLTQDFEVDPRSNRIGVRLSSALPRSHSVEKTSEPTEVGVIQLPPSGHPIILGPDGPTIGGYPCLGAVIRADLSRVGQLCAGARVRFSEVDAEGAGLAFKQFFDGLSRRSLLLRLNAGAKNRRN